MTIAVMLLPNQMHPRDIKLIKKFMKALE